MNMLINQMKGTSQSLFVPLISQRVVCLMLTFQTHTHCTRVDDRSYSAVINAKVVLTVFSSLSQLRTFFPQ